MAQAQTGDTVKVHYTGSLQDGTVFDSSQGRDPLQFTVGAGEVIEGFDQAVLEMQPGETKTITMSPEQGYGPEREDLIATVGRDQFPEGIEPEAGQELQMMLPNGAPILVQVRDVQDGQVTLDANHPLAGKDLTFTIELVDIVAVA